METDCPMHGLYAHYVEGKISRTELESALFSHIKSKPRRFKLGKWKEEEFGDFIGELYPTIRKAIDSYKNTGSCFDAYLYSTVRWSAVGYRSRAAETAAMERAYWMTKTVEATHDPESEYTADQDGDAGKLDQTILRRRRQVLALTLKCCLLVSDDFCKRIAPALALDPSELRETINGLRTRIAGRMQKRRELEELAASQFYRCVVLEAKAAAAPEGGAVRDKLRRSAVAARKRLEHLRAEASKVSIEATNREVAAVMKVPKGTIDASLYFLKRRCAPLHDVPGSRYSTLMTIWFATGNAHKRKELAAILAPHEVKIPADAGLAFDPEKTGDTFLENSLIKARALFDLVREPVVADDSGLCVDALGGTARGAVCALRFGTR